MKKVININFQGRIIPIEESAYEILKQYTTSLKNHFYNEEGKDEIINDIENRIAELLSEELKKNPTGCITDDSLEAIIKNIGRPEDFDEDFDDNKSSQTATGSGDSNTAREARGNIFRNAEDKVLGGVCSGLAYYLKIDPTLVRILFAIITFGGFGSGVLLYIILWIVLPIKGLKTNYRIRLYRNPDSRVLGGVASGIASYFNTAIWIPRLVFALPLVVSLFENIFGNWDNHKLFSLISGGAGGTLTLIYIILWAVVPEAKTASEKLEMRGEKVDLNTIKQTIQEEMQGFKGKASQFGEEVRDRAQNLGKDFSNASQTAGERTSAFANEVKPVAKSLGSRFLHIIGVLFKVFFLFIGGILVFALLISLIGILFSGISLMGLKDFILTGFWQNLVAFNTLGFLIGVPIIAILFWLIKRLLGIQSKYKFFGYFFGGLFFIGLISFLVLVKLIARDFRTKEVLTEDIALKTPSNNKLELELSETNTKFYNDFWFKFDEDEDGKGFPLLSEKGDSLLLNFATKIRIVPSKDSLYHAHISKSARGYTHAEATQTAQLIDLPINQQDSILLVPKGFPISKQSKFRNQKVLLIIKVPIGKQIRIANSARNFTLFNSIFNFNNADDSFGDDYFKEPEVWYIMTPEGPKPADAQPQEEKSSGSTI
jgi:phage shock protein PspC (stress-responsive transcriptional regulator)